MTAQIDSPESPAVDQFEYLRNANLGAMVDTLQLHRDAAVDMVVPASSLAFVDGNLVVQGMPGQPFGDEAIPGVPATREVRDVNGVYRPTRVGDETLSAKMGVPRQYLRTLRDEDVTLLDHNLNRRAGHEKLADTRFLVRLLHGVGVGADLTNVGVLRAVLSDRYRTIDNLDVVLAALDGMMRAGVEDPIITGDLTDRRMYLKVTAPGIAAYAPDLLAGYRSPFDRRDVGNGWTPERVQRAAGVEGMGFEPGAEPIVWAGFVITNSENGGGAFQITPQLTVRVCANGLTITADAMRRIHIGAKLDAGVVEWSAETIAANLKLITAQTTDAVRTYLTPEYVRSQVAALEAVAGTPVAGDVAPKLIEDVSQQVGFGKAQAASILARFIEGGQLTAGGVMQATTAAAQDYPADTAHEMESAATRVLGLASAAARR